MRVQAGYPVRIVLDLGHQSMAWLRSLEDGAPLSRIDLAAGPAVEARQRVTPLTVWGRTLVMLDDPVGGIRHQSSRRVSSCREKVMGAILCEGARAM